MSKAKKDIRDRFNNVVFKRDNFLCVTCFKNGIISKAIDAHHITDRNSLPNGGYVLENGISLCSDCHILAEEYHKTGQAGFGWYPSDLYKLINSSFEKAKKACLNKK